MDLNIFDIDNFNIIQDEDNYYFFRALNMADNSDIEQEITTSEQGKIERIRTDRERYDGTAKYSEKSEMSLEELYDHIKMHHRKDTNCISLTTNANISVNYGRSSYKDRYVMIKIPKKEFGEKAVSAGQYMLQELYSRIQEAIEKLPEEEKNKVLSIFKDIDDATENKTLQDIIARRYTAKESEITLSKAHLRHAITYSRPKARISSYQSLNDEQLLQVNKVYAKLAILENEDILTHVIPHSSNSKLRETIGNAFSSTEVIHYGEISQENIIEIPKEVVDFFSLIQQIDGIDKNKVEEVKRELLVAVQSGKKIPSIPEIDSKIKDNISIEEMYELTEGKVEYGKANTIVKNMYYLSKARKNAISLSYVLEEILGDNSGFEDIIEYIRNNGFRVEPEIISRQSRKGVKLSESINLNLQGEEQILVDDIKILLDSELEDVIYSGGLSNVREIITDVYGNKGNKIDKSRYYAEAIIAQYNWQDIGIKEFTISGRKELIKRLQEKECIDIYERLKEAGVEENKIPTVLLNIVLRTGFYEQYAKGNLTELLNTRQDILQENINIELVERFLGYYDVENSGLQLKGYQQKFSNKATGIFEAHNFAQVTLPTGAGKSFVAFDQMLKYAKEHPEKEILYLAPNDEILYHIKEDIKEYLHGMPNTEGKSIEQIIQEVFPNNKITFETYPGLRAKKGKEEIEKQYGMIVLDEIHRTGAPEWEKQVDKLLENQDDDVKVLGLSATPTRDVDGKDMAEKTARKLGYTDEEIKNKEYLAANISLETAIRLGWVVNPKIVYCKYDLISSGKMDELKAKVEEIEDESKRAEELQKFNKFSEKLKKEIDDEIGEDARKKLEDEARKNLESGIGKEEIIRQNVKKGGKYIVFIPVTDQNGDIEDVDGNKEGKKRGEDKIKAYQEYLKKIFEGTDIELDLYSMLGSYNKEKNQIELENFEADEEGKTKFMVVMNKANEGLHIKGVNGIIWLRALDENSRILYLQQLGRTIYAVDENNPITDEEKPIVIDLANNSLTVKIEKNFKKSEPIDDLEALKIIAEWVEEHDGMIPNGESSNKEEQHYYAVLRRIQSKYDQYLYGLDEYSDLEDEEKERIQEIIDIANEIELWDLNLPSIKKTKESKEEFDPFEIEGVFKDFVELKEEIEIITNENQKIAYLVKIAELLKEYPIDYSKIQLGEREYIEDDKFTMRRYKLSEMNFGEEVDIHQLILENNLDGEFPFGEALNIFRRVYKGTKNDLNVSENLIQRGLDLGLIGYDRFEEDIQLLEVLKENGVNLKKGLSKRLNKKERYYFKLNEIKQEGIDIQKIISENHLDGLLVLEQIVSRARSAYNNESRELSESQKKRIEKLDIIVEKSCHPYITKLNRLISGEAIINGDISPIKQYVKKHEVKNDLTDEEKEIIDLAYRSGIMDEINPYIAVLNDINAWQEKNKTTRLPMAKVEYRKMPEKERPEEYYLGKRKENLQNIFIKKYKDISDDEFEKLDPETREILIRSSKMGIGLKFDIIKRLRERLTEVIEKDEYKSRPEIWDENYELLKGLLEAKGEYFNLSQKEVTELQKYFKKNGRIIGSTKIIIDGKKSLIGSWLNTQYQDLFKSEIKIGDEERKRRKLKLEQLGVKYKQEVENGLSKFLRVCESLANQGFDFKRFEWTKRVNGNQKEKTLEDIKNEYSNIDIDKIMEETEIEINYPITNKLVQMKAKLNKMKEEPDSISENEKEILQRLIELGVVSLEKNSTCSIPLEVCECLANQGLDFRTFIWSKKGKNKTLEDIKNEYPNIDIDEILKEYEINLNYPISEKIHAIRKKYIKMINNPNVVSDKEKNQFQRLIELGVIKTIPSQSLGQATFTAGQEGQAKLDEADSVLAEAVIEEDKDKKETGGANLDDNN